MSSRIIAHLFYSVKVHPDLAVVVLHSKLDRQFRLWVLARAMDAEGSGRVALDDLQALLDNLQAFLDLRDTRLAPKRRGLSAGTVRRLLAAGDGVFWDRCRQGTLIRLRGLAQVCLALGVDHLRRTPVLVPVEDIGTLMEWRRWLYASWFGEDWSNPVSRRVLMQLTDKTVRTLHRYERERKGIRRRLVEHVEVRQNAATTGMTVPPRGEQIERGLFVDIVNHQPCVLQVLPNSFRTALERGKRGMMRRVNRTLAGHSARNLGAERRRQFERVFHTSLMSGLKRLHVKADDSFYVLGVAEVADQPAEKARGGAVLWGHWGTVGGRVLCT